MWYNWNCKINRSNGIENISKDIKIGIIGGGNVGTAFAVALSSKGYDVELVARRLKGVVIDNATNLNIRGSFGDKAYLIPVVKDIAQLKDKKDIIFMCTKSYDGLMSIPSANEYLKDDGVMVTIHNTYWIDSLKDVLDSKKSVCMYLDISFISKDEYTYVYDSGGITLGVYDREAFDGMNKVKSVLDNICDVKETHDLYGFLMGRSIINNAISSLGAISGMKLGDILNDRNGRYLFVKCITESLKLFKALNLNILPYDDKLDYYTFTSKTFKGWIYRQKIMRLLRINNKNIKSSALAEIERGKKTEIAHTLSNLINLSIDKNIDMPYTTAIRDMIVEIEENKRRVNDNAFYDKKLLNIKEN